MPPWICQWTIGDLLYLPRRSIIDAGGLDWDYRTRDVRLARNICAVISVLCVHVGGERVCSGAISECACAV